MGEALITRRGGTVKAGTIATITEIDRWDSYSLYDPALVGAKNAIIYFADDQEGAIEIRGSDQYRALIALIIIEEGNVVGIQSARFHQAVPNDSYNLYYNEQRTLNTVTFDATTGTVTTTGGRYVVDASPVPSIFYKYNYIVFD